MGTDILAQIRAAGITLSADGGNLVATPRAAITDDIRTLIREHKLALMAALAHPAADIIQAQLDSQQDLAVFAEERRQSDEAEAELKRLAAIRRPAHEAHAVTGEAVGIGGPTPLHERFHRRPRNGRGRTPSLTACGGVSPSVNPAARAPRGTRAGTGYPKCGRRGRS